MTPILKYTAYSDKGLLRKNNEDSVYAGQRLLALADGMGGHVGGEIASSLVISSLSILDADEPEVDILNQLYKATKEANALLAKKVSENPNLEGMGTTLTALLFTGSHMALTHIGDSKAYLIRNNQLLSLTRDDTFIQILIENGQLDPLIAQKHPQRSLILKALTGEDVEPTLSLLDIQLGDRFLICSDGLSDIVSGEEILKILHNEDTDVAAQDLIQKALSAGAPDNVTVLLADIVDGMQSEDRPILAGAIAEGKIGNQINIETDPLSFFYKPHKWKLRLLLVFLFLAILGSSASLYFFRSIKTNYFLGIENQKILIFQGASWHFSNISLSRPFLQICLRPRIGSTIEIIFSEPGTQCSSLTVQDLSPTGLQSLHDLPQSNTLNQTKDQAIQLINKLEGSCAQPPFDHKNQLHSTCKIPK